MALSPMGDRPRFVIDASYTQLYAYDGSGNIEYIGRAKPDTATDDAYWQIQKMAYDGSNNLTSVKWAEGSDEFLYAWDDRATYTYS